MHVPSLYPAFHDLVPESFAGLIPVHLTVFQLSSEIQVVGRSVRLQLEGLSFKVLILFKSKGEGEGLNVFFGGSLPNFAL